MDNRPTTNTTATPAENNTARPTTTRTEAEKKTESVTRTEGTSRTPQGTNYYGRTIGQPVKVEKQMRDNTARTTNNDDKTNKESTNNTRTNGNRR